MDSPKVKFPNKGFLLSTGENPGSNVPFFAKIVTVFFSLKKKLQIKFYYSQYSTINISL